MPHSSICGFIGLLLFLLFDAPSSKSDEVKVKHAGLTLNAELQLAEGKGLQHGAVLLVHGTLAHNGMDTIKNLSEVLNERGLNTLAINLSLGVNDRHGMYDCNTISRHKHLDALEEIAVWVEWLQSRDVGEIVLFGHSRGGNQVARYVTEKDVTNLTKAVLLAPSVWSAERAARGFMSRHGKSLAKVLARAEAQVKRGGADQTLLGVGLLYCKNADATASSFVSYYGSDTRFNTPSILKEFKIPVLVISGGKDTVVKRLAEAVRPIADGKLISFGMVDDADHFFLDLFAEDVADFMEDFFGGRRN